MIGIVTDSTCDIPDDIVDAERDRLVVVPALINLGVESFRDGIDITRETFYRMLPKLKRLPSTSAPGPGVFHEVYKHLLEKTDQIVSVHAASSLSGIYNSACIAAQQFSPQCIHVIDSGQLSMGVGWSVLKALTCAKTSTSVEPVVATVRNTITRVRVYALLNTVEYLARSGRVNLVQAGISNLLNIKPIVELRNGAVVSAARVRTWSKALTTLISKTCDLMPIEHLAVMHTGFPSGAQEVANRIYTLIPDLKDILVTNVTTVIGAHVGPNAIGVAVVTGAQEPAHV
nr:DegV family protein [Anaerolineae bacterium]